MEFETQMIKDCPELKLVVFFHFFFFLYLSFSVHVCLMSELVHFRQTGAAQEQRRGEDSSKAVGVWSFF